MNKEKEEKLAEISARITQVIAFLDETPNSFATKLGYSRAQTVYDIQKRKSAPSYDFFQRFSNAGFSAIVDLDWLLTGEGSMLRPDEPPTNSVTPSTDAPEASMKPDESILYNMYKDLQAEKREKEAEIKELNAKMLAMSEEIGRLKAKLGEDEPEIETHLKGLGKGTAKNVSTRPHSSQPSPDAPSAGVPSDGR